MSEEGRIDRIFPLGILLIRTKKEKNCIFMYLQEQCIVLLFLSAIAFVDCKSRKIPNFISLIFLGSRMVLLGICFFQDWISAKEILRMLAEWAVFSVFLLLFWKFSRGGLGGGDVKVLSILCLYVGTNRILWILWLMGIAVCLSHAVKKKKAPKEEIPLGPYILLAYLVVTLFHLQVEACQF